tara:strand:- start:2618 stop:3265 length:648 start_codon:yes stop_codon:yes gene_type:complete
MAEYYKEILAFLGFCLALYGYFYKFHEANLKAGELLKVKEENKELKKKFNSSSFVIDLFQLNSIREIVDVVFESTHIDRFLVLSAMNGKDEFAFVSALYEQHEQSPQGKLSMGATSKYIDLKTDDTYKKMVKSIELFEPMVAQVSRMPEGMLKHIYLSEEIKHTMLIFSHRQRLDADNDRVFFMSFASHEDKPIDYATQSKLKGATKRITEHLKG